MPTKKLLILKNILNYIDNTPIIIFASLFLALLITFLSSYSKNIQSDISQEVIRFHVLANSNSQADQALKIKVKNEVIKMLSAELKESQSKAETKAILIKNLNKIEEKASEIIKAEGYSYAVKAELGYSTFPTKVYGDISLPAGEYQALKILIGNAQGNNWWCVMFPPLCFVDASAKTVPLENKEQLKDVLNEEEYSLISSPNSPKIQVKFKVVELFNSL